MKSLVVKRSIKFADHKTSVSLEDAFWNALKEIAGERDVTLSALIEMIDAHRQNGNLSSAIRLFVLSSYRDQICDLQGRPRETLLPSDARPSEISDQAQMGPEA